MAKWESLNEAERELVRSQGGDPAGMVVNRVGTDTWVFLDVQSREEVYIRLADDGGVKCVRFVPQIQPPKRPWM